jgi:hypothetical protein
MKRNVAANSTATAAIPIHTNFIRFSAFFKELQLNN